VRASVVQFAAATDVATNLDRIEALVTEAATAGAELIVVPEAAMHDFGPPDLPLGPVAQTLDGEFVHAISRLARQHGATVVAGMFEKSDDVSRPFNTLIAAGPDGDLLASYRKAHLYDSFGYRESDRLSRSDVAPTVVPTGDFKVGLMTCYDLRFPEFSRALVDAGADVLVVPAAWVRGPLKEDHWTTLLRARAIENTVYVVAAAQTGSAYVGCSAVIDPMGVIICSLGEEEAVATGEVNRARLESVRSRNPSLMNRRRDELP
jgi:deaminated glutathione amidase